MHHWVPMFKPKTVLSVLTKMSRDCTELLLSSWGCTVLLKFKASNTKLMNTYFQQMRQRATRPNFYVPAAAALGAYATGKVVTSRRNPGLQSGTASQIRLARNMANSQEQKRVNNIKRQLNLQNNRPIRQTVVSAPTSAPVAFSGRTRITSPKIKATRNMCHIHHKEFLANVTGTANWTLQYTYALNPGLPASFPWLSTQAQAWEMYKFNSVKYIFHTFAPTSTAGAVSLIPDYDAADGQPPNELAASSYQNMVEDACWKDIVCSLSPKAMSGIGKEHFVRITNTAGDIKTYDSGNFYVATSNSTSTPPLGKLWVEYDVTLTVPTNVNNVVVGGLSFQDITGNGQSTGNNFNNATLQSGSPIVTTSLNSLIFNYAGYWLVTYASYISSGTTTYGAPSFVGVTSSSNYTYYNNNAAGSATAHYLFTGLVKSTVGGDMSFNETMSTAGTNWQLSIMAVTGTVNF
jgi:hypothetical protein